MNKSLHIGIGSTLLSNCHGHTDVGLFKVRLILRIDLGADAVDNNILVSDDMGELFLVCKVVQLNISFVSKISCWFDFLEFVIPECGLASVWVHSR